MNHLWRLSLCTAVICSTMLVCLAAPWEGGRGAGNRASFPTIAFPHAPAVVWKAYLGKDLVNIPPSNTLEADNTVMVAYGTYLLGLSAETGELRWEVVLPELPADDLLLLDDQVIVSMPSGLIDAINPADGKIVWKQRLRGGLLCDPTYTDTYFLFTSKVNTVEAIERKTGTHLGTTDVQDKLEVPPLFFEHSLIMAYTEGAVQRVDEDQDKHWSCKIPDAVISMTPITDGKAVYVCYGNTIIALNPNNIGKPAFWIANFPDQLQVPATLDENRLYIAGDSGQLFALDAATGKNLWFSTKTTISAGKAVTEKQPGLPLLPFLSEKQQTEETAAAGTDTKVATASRTSTATSGSDAVRTDHATPVGAPIVLGDSLLVRMECGIMAVYDKKTGAIKWLYRLKPPVGLSVPTTAYMGSPAIVGNDVYFAGMDGNVYRLSANAPDNDPPSFDYISPTAEKGYIAPDKVEYLGAIVQDEGCGLLPLQMTLSLDGKDMTKTMVFDPGSGFFYYKRPTKDPLRAGMHRLVISCPNARGKVGTLSKDFIVAPEQTKERVVINIRGEFVPKHLVVQPGTVISWHNETGSPRTIIADQTDYADITHFDSDDVYPDGIPDGAQWVWIVPNDLDAGSMIYYHCRLKGQAGDGEHFGQGSVGVIEIGNPATQP